MLIRKIKKIFHWRFNEHDWFLIIFCIGVSIILVSLLSLLQGDSIEERSNYKDSQKLFNLRKKLYDSLDEDEKAKIKESFKKKYRKMSEDDKKKVDGFIKDMNLRKANNSS